MGPEIAPGEEGSQGLSAEDSAPRTQMSHLLWILTAHDSKALAGFGFNHNGMLSLPKLTEDVMTHRSVSSCYLSSLSIRASHPSPYAVIPTNTAQSDSLPIS